MTTTKKKPKKKILVHKKGKPLKKKVKQALLKPKLSEQYLKALKDFDRAVHDLNRGAFPEAKAKFQDIIEKHSQERALRERAMMYIKICEQSGEKHAPRLKELDEFYTMGIVHINNENYEEAIKYLEKALSFDSKSEKVVFTMAAAHALKGDKDESLNFLKTAIKLEPRSRMRAKMDPDFDSLRTDAEFNDLIEPKEEEIV